MYRVISVGLLGLLAMPAVLAQTSYDDTVVGYAYASPSGTLQFGHLYNRSTGDITISHPETGVYTYRFHDVSTEGSYIPQIAWPMGGTTPQLEYCSIDGYGLAVFEDFRWIRVNCFDDSGNPQDDWTQVLLLDEGSSTGNNHHIAFADSLEPVPSGDMLDLTGSITNNPGGGSTTLHREGIGEYEVRMEGLGSVMQTGASVQVSAFSGSARSCSLESWTLNFAGSDNSRFRIRCQGIFGQADSRFTLLVTSTEPDASGPASAHVDVFDTPSTWTELTGDRVHNPHGRIDYRWDNPGYQVRFEWPSDTSPGVAFSTYAPGGATGFRLCSNSSAHRPSGESKDFLQVNVKCLDGDGVHSVPFTILMTQVVPTQDDQIFSDRFE